MASNKELMSDITTLCLERGVAVPDGLDQLKNAKLMELLDGLRVTPAVAPVVETALRPLVAPSPLDGAEGDGDPAVTDVAPGAQAPAAADAVVATALAAAPRVSVAPNLSTTGASGYFVAAGKTVSTLRRETQGAYEQVYASDFSDGQPALDALLASGYLFKR
jgi:hypothetical protein